MARDKAGARRVIIKTLRTGISRASEREARFEKVFALAIQKTPRPERPVEPHHDVPVDHVWNGKRRERERWLLGVDEARQWTLLIYREFEKGEGRETR